MSETLKHEVQRTIESISSGLKALQKFQLGYIEPGEGNPAPRMTREQLEHEIETRLRLERMRSNIDNLPQLLGWTTAQNSKGNGKGTLGSGRSFESRLSVSSFRSTASIGGQPSHPRNEPGYGQEERLNPSTRRMSQQSLVNQDSTAKRQIPSEDGRPGKVPRDWISNMKNQGLGTGGKTTRSLELDLSMPMLTLFLTCSENRCT
jgi:hypothetical protein